MHSRPYESILDLIGDTPILHLRSLTAVGAGEVFGKLEFYNPGGSVKDRPALAMIEDAEARGQLQPGATIIEPTAGNTGIGLALVGVTRGYRVIVVMPRGFSREKMMLVEALGAEVVHSPEEGRMAGAIARARELAKEIPAAFIPQQFENPSNPDCHYATTAAEMWEQMEGRLDALVVGAGTGGTFTGLVRYFKERRPEVLAVLVEPEGSIFAGGEAGNHRVEGIGNSFWPKVLDRDLVDEVMTITDAESFDMVRHLARHEGVLVGGSSGANAVASRRVAARLHAGARVATLLPDSMDRYLSRGPAGDSKAETVNIEQGGS